MPRDVHHLETSLLETSQSPTEPKLRRRKAIVKPALAPQPGSAGAQAQPFWKTKAPAEMSHAEWESLCDGCGRCCLVKLEDEDTGEIHFTDVGCRLLDGTTCQCSDYRRRRQRVRDCLKLTPDSVKTLNWLPPTCGYKLVTEGRDLPWWHPLVSGSRETVHEAGVSVRGRVAALETEVKLDDYPDYIVSWPKKVPEQAKAKNARRKPTKKS